MTLAWEEAPRLVDIGGRRLAVQVQRPATDPAGPPVVLEIGGGGSGIGAHWNGIDRAVAEFATVITYNRAGLGYSDDPPAPPTVADMADDLGNLLDAIPVDGPFVLAGWSLGGLLAEYFAAANHDRVAGLVLIDPSPPDTIEITAELMSARAMWLAKRAAAPMMAAQGLMARTGPGRALLGRMTLAQFAPGAPEDAKALMVAEMSNPVMMRRMRLVTARMEESCAQTQRILAERGLPDVPVTVLTAGWRGGGMGDRMGPFIAKSHAHTAGLSPRGKQVVVEHASHQLPLEDPGTVVEAIREVVETAGS